MASRSSYTKNKTRSRGETVEYVPVRSNILYGIETTRADQQKKTIQREILVVPNITFYSSFTKILIDFSDYRNNQEKSDVKSFFDLMKNGYSFSMTNAKWNNRSIDEITYDISGTFTYTKISDSIIFADVVSVNSYSTNISRYDKEYFIELPLLEFDDVIESTKAEVKSYIFNYLGKNSKNSFSYLGAKAGDYIELQTADQKYKIDTITVDTEGKETVVVYGDLGSTSSVGNPILVTLHQKNIDKLVVNHDNVTTGKCELYKDGKQIDCLDNHTLLQAKLREDKANGITAVFTEGSFCSQIVSIQTEETVKAIVPTLTEQITALTNAQSIRASKASAINSTLLSRSNLISTIFSE